MDKPEIIKAYRQSVGASRFIGKRYTNSDRGPSGLFDIKWMEWNEKGWFDLIQKQIKGSFKVSYEESKSPIGLMCQETGKFETFEYWIGYFTPENTDVPEGFEYVDFPKSELGVCWMYGNEDEVFCLEASCATRLTNEGFEIITDWLFERYAYPRFDVPDEKGNIILDICFFIK